MLTGIKLSSKTAQSSYQSWFLVIFSGERASERGPLRPPIINARFRLNDSKMAPAKRFPDTRMSTRLYQEKIYNSESDASFET